MKSPILRLLCDSNPMCYGSTSALLSILDYIVAESTALVRDVTADLLVRDALINNVIYVDNKSPDAVRNAVNFSEFDAVLVVGNQSNVHLYADVGLAIFFVDLLYWYGVRKDQPVWDLAECSFVQNFPGVDRRLQSLVYLKPPVLVGPLMRRMSFQTKRQGTFIQIGGARSRWIQPGVNSFFSSMVLDWVCHNKLDFPRPVTLGCGREAAAAARGNPLASLIQIDSFGYDGFLSNLCQSEVYVTTPGQGAVFEGLWADVDMLFLPPQNASQVLQLDVYERAELVSEGLNLMALDPDFDCSLLKEPEEKLTAEVLLSLSRLNTKEVADRVSRHLQRQYEDLELFRPARRDFLDFLGSPGSPVVAQAITRWWNERWM